MWYRFAQNVERAYDTLKSKGVSDEIISQLQTMTDIPLRGKYIGALMQNPLMSWNELEEKLTEKKHEKLSIQEMRLMSILDDSLTNSNLTEDQKANYYKWVDRVALPSYRPNQHDPENYTYPKFSNLVNPIFGIQEDIDHIFDWYADYVDNNPRFNIFSMTLEQALQASNQWHEELANQTTTETFSKIKKENGKIVDPDVVMVFDEIIIDSLKLSEEYVNWMIVKLTVESDFDLEGKIMGHCLGTNNFYYKYENGISEIYSLRDESNKPHATIEIILPDTVKQIQGKGDKRPKEDYLKLVQHWIYSNNYYSDKKTEHELYFRTGGTETNALESIHDYLNPYFDPDATDDYGVPFRPITVDEEEFVRELDVDYLIDRIGRKRTSGFYDDPEFYKSYQDIEDDDKFEELISVVGDLYIQYDINLLRDYASQSYPLGFNARQIRNKLKLESVKDDLINYISTELDQIGEEENLNFQTQKNGYTFWDFNKINPEQIDEIANKPYVRKPFRGRAKVGPDGKDILQEYDGIFDIYPVYFANSLYNYMIENYPMEFYQLAAKIGLKLDNSPVTASSVIQYENSLSDYYRRHHQLSLFDANPGKQENVQEWVYAYNNKRYRLASVQDEGITDFNYKDLIKSSDDITDEEIIENIKNYYINEVMKQFVSESPNYDNEFYANMTEELHSMWEEYLDDIRKGDISSLEHVMKIAMNYNHTLSENSIEHEKLSEMLSSGEIASRLKRNS